MVLVVPGPIGLYRRAVLQRVFNEAAHARDPELHKGGVPGPFSPETFAEDFQLSLTILAMGGRIVYEPNALSYTKSPDLTQTLLNQRYRWFRGTLQVLRIYLRRLRQSSEAARRLGLVITAVYLLDLFVLPVLNAVILIGVGVTFAMSASPTDLLLWIGAIWLLNVLTATYHVLAQQDDISLVSLVPIYDLYQGVLLNSAWAIAMIDEARQSKMSW
jgi:biofilm PGA synthesis N-glycosyltransferase PgaC